MEAQSTPARALHSLTASLIYVFGMLLPFFTLGFELSMAWCAAIVFDPVPSLPYQLAVALVGLANGLTCAAMRRGDDEAMARWAPLNALAIGIALFYTIAFLPILPLGAMMLVAYGLGLLPLSPLLALLCALWMRWGLVLRVGSRISVWPGLLAGFLGLWLLGSGQTRATIGSSLARSADPATRARGMALLRGTDETTVRRVLQSRFDRPPDPVSTALQFPVFFRERFDEAADDIFYKATGKALGSAFSDLPVRQALFADFRWTPFDPHQGGEAIGDVLPDLALTTSSIQGFVDGDAALAYLEWTMVLANSGERDREARAELVLPPGATVSRVTLWIDGQEREAAFGERSQVRAAYESVVRRQRDPLLVTTTSPDRVLAQCFPVPPKGEMKIRLGMTCPLGLPSAGLGELALPRPGDRNYRPRPGLTHRLALVSRGRLSGTGPVTAEPAQPGWLDSVPASIRLAAGTRGDAFALAGEVPDELLEGGTTVVRVERDPARSQAWCMDERAPLPAPVLQTIAPLRRDPPARLVVVVDTSREMAEGLEALAGTLARLPADLPVTLVAAGDAALVLDRGPASPDSTRRFAGALRALVPEGGIDAAPALLAGLAAAGPGPGPTVLWVHGAQPVELPPPLELLDRLAETDLRILSLQVGQGRNRLAEALQREGRIAALPGVGAPADRLGALFDSWAGRVQPLAATRAKVARLPEGIGPAGPDHLVRLWARDEIDQLSGGSSPAPTETFQLATRWQLVTPISGAVVLETKAQYEQNGLEPADPKHVPSVPEPGALTVAFLAAAAAALGRRKRTGAGAGAARPPAP